MMSHPSFRRCATIAAAVLLLSPLARGEKLHPSEDILKDVLRRPDAWYRSDEGRHLVDNIASWQNPNGGWWKKYNPEEPRPAQLPPPDLHDAPPGDTEDVWRLTSTFDNDATWLEMQILGRAYRLTGQESFKAAFNRGLGFIFASQYPNGGWPQRFPLQNNYGRYITFNDNAMTNVMNLLKDILDGNPDYAFVSPADRDRCRRAFDRGIDCILKCQIRVHGRLTAWCQQHDPVTFEPRGGRAFELPAITGSESASIIYLLMRIEHPDERIRQAIDAATDWYQQSALTGIRFEAVRGPQYENGHDKIVVDDPSAPPLWARFYDIDTNKPFFCGRDGVKRWKVSEISWERRNYYGWYGSWGRKVAKADAEWKQKLATTVPATNP